jgi:hypothetical protein
LSAALKGKMTEKITKNAKAIFLLTSSKQYRVSDLSKEGRHLQKEKH